MTSLAQAASDGFAAGPPRPVIRNQGTLDLGMVEATPVVFRGRLDRFESVRKDDHANQGAKASERAGAGVVASPPDSVSRSAPA
jgi:hypothetical protein